MNRLVIREVLLVTPRADPRSVDVVISGETIEAVEPARTVSRDAPSIDGAGLMAMPGLVNAHTHSHNALSKGFGDAWALELLLNYGPALNARRTPEDHYVAALLNGLEMLKCGATSAYDLVIHAPAPTVESLSAVVRAYRDLGMRAVVAPAVADLPFYAIVPGLVESLPADLRAELEAVLPVPAEQLLGTMHRALGEIPVDSLVRLAVAPTIPAQCSDDFLVGAERLAREFEVGFHTHLAESRVQAIEGLRRYGTSLTQHLDALGILGPRFVGAHAVWLDEEDTNLLAGRGGSVAHNPASNLKLGSGVAPVRDFIDAGIRVGIGTDGSASSDNQNMFEAMRMASLVSRLSSVDPARWVDAPAVLEAATCTGGAVCGFAERSGRIEPGAPADLVLLRRDSIFLQPANVLPTQLVHSETASAVDTVIVAGTIVLEHGRSTRIDEASVHARAQAAIDRVRTLNAAEWELARRMSPYIVQTYSALASVPLAANRLMLRSST